MTPEVTDFIPGSLEDTDKFIEVADGHHVTAKQKGSVSSNDPGMKSVTSGVIWQVALESKIQLVSCEVSS